VSFAFFLLSAYYSHFLSAAILSRQHIAAILSGQYNSYFVIIAVILCKQNHSCLSKKADSAGFQSSYFVRTAIILPRQVNVPHTRKIDSSKLTCNYTKIQIRLPNQNSNLYIWRVENQTY